MATIVNAGVPGPQGEKRQRLFREVRAEARTLTFDLGWAFVAGLCDDEMAQVLGGRVEVFDGAMKKLAAVGAKPDRKSAVVKL